jgi:uncharacterized protein
MSTEATTPDQQRPSKAGAEPPSIAHRLAAELGLPATGVREAVALFDGGSTVPFVARYRKEATGGLDENELRAVAEGRERLRALDERRTTILTTLRELGVLSSELERAVQAADTRTALEDLYAPHRPRRRTRATMARERGLAPLAEAILAQPHSGPPPRARAAAFVGDEVPDVEAALAGARDIVAEGIADEPAVRQALRAKAATWAGLRAKRRGGKSAGEDPKGVFEAYYDFDQRVDRLRPHQVLALDRGEAEKVLRIAIDIPERDWRDAVAEGFRPDRRSSWAGELASAIEEAAARLLLPAIERDLRRSLTEEAHEHAREVFARNLAALLRQQPLGGHVVLGVDPAYRTGCKLAIVDATGAVLATDTIYPHAPQRQTSAAKATVARLVRAHGVTLITIGNGTASRETEAFIAALLPELAVDGLRYTVVNEAGASVYSASPLAGHELPELNVSLRGAVSIARRVQDPLAELVKIDPQSIGVGLYQHDLDEAALSRVLDGVVEDVVNAVGADLNTASPALLSHIAGLGPRLAEATVAHRDAHGAFARRKDLLAVAGLGPKTFEQAAGFLRVHGREPLDASAIHPESYAAARALLRRAGLDPRDPPPPDARAAALDRLRAATPPDALATDLNIGRPTLEDILEQLVRPGLDPRADAPSPLLRGEAMSMSDLPVGAILPGTVRNVVDFGAFVDIGVGQDGLVHRSRLGRGRHLHDLSVGDVIEVEVLSVETERGRIGLGWVVGEG